MTGKLSCYSKSHPIGTGPGMAWLGNSCPVVKPPPQQGTVDAEIKIPSVENLEPLMSVVLPLKPGVGQNTAMHVSRTVRNFSHLIVTSTQFSFIYFKPSVNFVIALAVANVDSWLGPQMKMGHPACCQTQLMQVFVVGVHRL